MKILSSQAIFDLIIQHLRNQNSKSPKYYGDNGEISPLALFIRRQEFVPDMEDLTLHQILEKYNFAAKATVFAHKDIINDLQLTYDLIPISRWEERFSQLALHHGVKLLIKN